MTELIVNAAGIALILFIIVWFWFSKKRATAAAADETIEIIVDNGVYTPVSIHVDCGKTVTLRFIRKDPSQCAAAVIFDDFNISTELEVDVPTDIIITPTSTGEFAFTCEMAMYQGTLIVTAR